jgi:glycosyltransferase involved in cell wall biosynthesis
MGRSLLGNLVKALRLVRSLETATTVYSTGETWGLPVALAGGCLRRRFPHVIYAHRLYSPLWRTLLRRLRPLLQASGWICVNRHQANLLGHTLGDRSGRIDVISQGVDTHFFDPTREGAATLVPLEPYILSVGAEMRDYPLLLAAVQNLDIPLVLKTSSTWMGQLRQKSLPVPATVTVLPQRLSYIELRALYAGAILVALPLHDTVQAAGITTLLEGMAMGKPVVMTRSRGLPDGLVSGENCLVVDPDPVELGEGLVALLENPLQRERMAANGRRFVLAGHRLEDHARRIGGFLHALAVRE